MKLKMGGIRCGYGKWGKGKKKEGVYVIDGVGRFMEDSGMKGVMNM